MVTNPIASTDLMCCARLKLRSEEDMNVEDHPFSSVLSAPRLVDTDRTDLRLGGCASGQSRLALRGA